MNIGKALNSASKYYQSGDFRQAERICKKILIKKPDNAEALHCIGVIYFQSGRHELAIEYIKKALHIDPNFADAYNNLGVIFQETRKLDEAIASYQKTLMLNPHSTKTYYNLGVCLHERGFLDKAIECYQKALRLNFRTVGLLNNLGLALSEKGLLDESLFYIQKALEMNRNDTGSLNNMGMILQKKGELDEAIKCYQQALRIDPSSAKAYYNMGLALQGKGCPEDAKLCFRQSIQLDPKNPSAYRGLYQVYHSEGQRFAPEKSSFAAEHPADTLVVQIDNARKLLYVVIPKASTTTIKHTLFFQPIFGNCDYPEILQEINHIIGWDYITTLEPYKNYFKFTVVRDPYTRFMSAFFHLIHKDYRYRNNFHVIEALGIEDWPDEIVTDPNKFLQHADKELLNRDPHTALQTHILPKNLNELDYIGQLENMKEVEEKLSQILGVTIEFGRIMLGNKAPKRDYHSITINVDRFNQLFAEDYEALKDFYIPLKK